MKNKITLRIVSLLLCVSLTLSLVFNPMADVNIWIRSYVQADEDEDGDDGDSLVEDDGFNYGESSGDDIQNHTEIFIDFSGPLYLDFNEWHYISLMEEYMITEGTTEKKAILAELEDMLLTGAAAADGYGNPYYDIWVEEIKNAADCELYEPSDGSGATLMEYIVTYAVMHPETSAVFIAERAVIVVAGDDGYSALPQFTDTGGGAYSIPLQPNSISGMVWDDGNGMNKTTDWNGTHDPGELPVAGFTVYLFDENDLVSPKDSAVSGDDGVYCFSDIEPGRYVLGITSAKLSGVEYTVPFGGEFVIDWGSDPLFAYTNPFDVDELSAFEGYDIGLRQPMAYAAASTVYDDEIDISTINSTIASQKGLEFDSIRTLWFKGAGTSGKTYRIYQSQNNGSHNGNLLGICADGAGVTGYNITFVLDGITVNDPNPGFLAQSPILLVNNVNMTLNFIGDNWLQNNASSTLSPSNNAGIAVQQSCSITINGTGSLTAIAGASSSGIGGTYLYSNAGTITINSGFVYAKGGYGGAGIGGGGGGGNGGTVNIGGNAVVIASGDVFGTAANGVGAGIGGGGNLALIPGIGGTGGNGGTVNITGNANVTAIGGLKNGGKDGGAGIGGGYGHNNLSTARPGNPATINIASTATVKAYSNGTNPAIHAVTSGGSAGNNGDAYYINAQLNTSVNDNERIVRVYSDAACSEEIYDEILAIPPDYRCFAVTTGTSTAARYLRAFENTNLVGDIVIRGTFSGQSDGARDIRPVRTATVTPVKFNAIQTPIPMAYVVDLSKTDRTSLTAIDRGYVWDPASKTLTFSGEGNYGAGDKDYRIIQSAGYPGHNGNVESIIIDGSGVTNFKTNMEIDKITVDHDSENLPAMELKNGAEVTLTLTDSSTLRNNADNVVHVRTNAGINVPNGCKLTIRGNGSLDVSGGSDSAGIGGGGNSGTITITDTVTVTAAGGNNGAGIGGGASGDGGTISIGGSATVTAAGGNNSAGIGGGASGAGGTISIVGSAAVTADGGNNGAGVGGGASGGGGNISIGGSATVTADGGNYGAGIGGGGGSDLAGGGGTVIISGGNVTATGGENSAGIGGGGNAHPVVPGGDGGSVTIEGPARVTATGGEGGAGIGGGIGSGGSMGGADLTIADTADVKAYSTGSLPAIHAQTIIEDSNPARWVNCMLNVPLNSAARLIRVYPNDTYSEDIPGLMMTIKGGYRGFAFTTGNGAGKTTNKYLKAFNSDTEMGKIVLNSEQNGNPDNSPIMTPVNTTSVTAVKLQSAITIHTVTYNLNGGTGIVPEEDDKAPGAVFIAAGAAALLNINPPAGKKFNGWDTIQGGTGTRYAAGADVTMPAGSLVLYAQWEDYESDWDRLSRAINNHSAATITIYPKGHTAVSENLAGGILIIQDNVADGSRYIKSTGTPITVERDVKIKGLDESWAITLLTSNAANGRHFNVLTGASAFSFKNLTIDGDGVAGGVNIASTGAITLHNADIQNCAAENGGGLYFDGDNLTITNGTINGNKALSADVGGNGGGVYVNSGALTMIGGTISNNRAESISGGGTGNGGGVYINTGTFNMNSGTISGNTAAYYGGGVYLADLNGGHSFSGGAVFYGNTADLATNLTYPSDFYTFYKSMVFVDDGEWSEFPAGFTGEIGGVGGANFMYGFNQYDIGFATYTLTYNGNSNTGGAVPAVVIVPTAFPAAIVSDNVGNLERTSYVMCNADGEMWSTDSGESNGTGGTRYKPGDTITLTEDRTIYAVWTAARILTFNANGGENGTVADKTVGSGNPVGTLPTTLAGTAPTMEGHTFLGWSLQSGAENSVNFTEISKISVNTTVYAVWEITRILEFVLAPVSLDYGLRTVTGFRQTFRLDGADGSTDPADVEFEVTKNTDDLWSLRVEVTQPFTARRGKRGKSVLPGLLFVDKNSIEVSGGVEFYKSKGADDVGFKWTDLKSDEEIIVKIDSNTGIKYGKGYQYQAELMWSLMAEEPE